ncbi:hypothetical protein ACVWW1_008718 [Bradyrhizobium sp. JR3.5]
MALAGTTKLLPRVKKEEEGSSVIDPLFKGIFESLKPTSSVRPYGRINTSGERIDTRLRYALSVGALGSRLMLARHLSLPFSIATSCCRMSYCPRVRELHRVRALAVAKVGEVKCLATHLGCIWCRVGQPVSMATGTESWRYITSHLQIMMAAMEWRWLKQGRNRVLCETSAGLEAGSSTGRRTARANSSRGLLGIPPEKLRPIANDETRSHRCWKERRDGSNPSPQFARWTRERQRRYYLARHTALPHPSAVDPFVTLLTTV